jgi:transposase
VDVTTPGGIRIEVKTSGRVQTWAQRSRLEPMKEAARTIRDHLWGITNGIVLHVSNAGSESINSRIEWIKKMTCGFCNRERFKNAISLHFRDLDLYPRTASASHAAFCPPIRERQQVSPE